jgi:hypothetical protein
LKKNGTRRTERALRQLDDRRRHQLDPRLEREPATPGLGHELLAAIGRGAPQPEQRVVLVVKQQAGIAGPDLQRPRVVAAEHTLVDALHVGVPAALEHEQLGGPWTHRRTATRNL